MLPPPLCYPHFQFNLIQDVLGESNNLSKYLPPSRNDEGTGAYTFFLKIYFQLLLNFFFCFDILSVIVGSNKMSQLRKSIRQKIIFCLDFFIKGLDSRLMLLKVFGFWPSTFSTSWESGNPPHPPPPLPKKYQNMHLKNFFKKFCVCAIFLRPFICPEIT